MEIKIVIQQQEVIDALNQLSNKMSDLTPVMREIAGHMRNAVEENFEQEGRPKWDALKQSTILQRTGKGHWPGKILQVSGQLAASISSQYDASSAQVGTNKTYGIFHQLGTSKMSARPFLVLSDDDMAIIMDTINRYIGGKNK